jgi:peptide/nickel transport system substrate-binding protein
MRSSKRAVLAGLIAAGAAAVVAAGCGGSSPSGGAAKAPVTSVSATPAGAAVGTDPSVFKVAWGDIDYFDPALAYGYGWLIVGQSYLGLLGYQHAPGPAGTQIVPGLAAAMPKVSSDGRTYTFTLRPGVKYSNGQPVRASDFKYAVERLFKINSPALGFVAGLQGAAAYTKHPTGSLAGVQADDGAATVTFKLTEPRGDFLDIVALSFLVPVPAGTPAKDQSSHPIPSAGPFEITSYTPGESFTLTRNPYYHAVAGIPAARPAKVEGQVVKSDAQALDMTLAGTVDYTALGVPTDRLAEMQKQHPDQLKANAVPGTHYFFMNERRAPFDKLAVRKAVNYAIDRDALTRLAGGLASPTENLLPPSYPSYQKITAFPHDLAKAKALIKSAGAVGAPVTVVGKADTPFPKKAVLYLTDVLGQIGLKPHLKLLSTSVYDSTAGSEQLKADIGQWNWGQDYPHPLDWFDILLNGEHISKVGNLDHGFVDIKELNQRIDKLRGQPTLTPEVNREWAAIDRDYVVKYAALAPYANAVLTDFFSSRVDGRCYVPLSIYRYDLTQACVK